MATLILNSEDLKKKTASIKNIESYSGYFSEICNGVPSFYNLEDVDVIMYREGNKDILIKAPNKE